MSLFRIVDLEGRGKVVLAAVDILAGSLVFEEDALLVFEWPGNLTAQSKSFFFTFCDAFDKVPSDKKTKYLQLYGPTNGPEIQLLRVLLLASNRWKNDAEKILKAYSVLRLNAFELDEGLVGVFENVTRMSHSCRANCVRAHSGQCMSVRAVCTVKAGEELTISYAVDRDEEPTHTRRHAYLQFKDFTCHCPRCDALGDDTRQFNCFNARCPGSHLVCQPINQLPTRTPGRVYTGVEYVEPHLLPCTVCQRSPSPEYQTAMFQLEEQLSEQIQQLKEGAQTASAEELLRRLRALQALPVPRASVMHLQWSNTRLWLSNFYRTKAGENPPRDVILRSAELDVASLKAVQSIFPLPSEQRYDTLVRGAGGYVGLRQAGLAKQCGLEAVRVRAILRGREDRDPSQEAMLMQILQLPSMLPHTTAAATVPSMEVCAFCEESPLRAAMKRSRCGACMKVMYCSVGCQKAHWPLHKAQCKKLRAV